MSDTNPVFSGPASSCAWVEKVAPQDVISGRGSGPNDHEGNVRFRNIVKRRKTEYNVSSTHRSYKSKIAQETVNSTRENGARFLRKATANERERLGIPEETEEAWLLMDDTAILEKAKQALRQKGQHHGGDSMIAAIKRGKPQKRRASQRKRSRQKTEKPSQVQSQAYVDPRIVDLHVSDDLQVTNDVLDMEPLDWRTCPSCQTKVQYEYQGNITQHLGYANQSQESVMTRGEEARTGVAFRASTDWSDDSLTAATTMVANDDDCEEEFLGKRFYPFSFQGNSLHTFKPWEG